MALTMEREPKDDFCSPQVGQKSWNAVPRLFRTRLAIMVIATIVFLGLSTSLVDRSNTDPVDNRTLYAPSWGRKGRKGRTLLGCPTDPFAKPGALHIGAFPNDTRWLPFAAGSAHPLLHPTLNSTDSIEYDVNEYDPMDYDDPDPQYMRLLSGRDPSMHWATNKTVLFLGASHDRDNNKFFCENVDGKYTNVATQMFGFCHIEAYNFTSVTWFLYGMADGDFDWYAGGMARPFPFEGRFPTFMLRQMANHQLPEPPDLIIESSLFWDERFLRERAVHHHRIDTTGPLTHSEINWHRSRFYKLVAATQQLYPAVPIMIRTRHFRRENSKNRILRIFQLDQNVRSVARNFSLKLFRWGDLLEGQTEHYHDKDHHFINGPENWLWGNMVLFYLKRAIVPECWKHHEEQGT